MKLSLKKAAVFSSLIIVTGFTALKIYAKTTTINEPQNAKWWSIQSIDTVKYSRDIAREKAKDTSFDQTIDNQVRLIAETGATHISLGTPYDKEFVPFLERWVKAARKYSLNVWFRGNFSGWEKWFGYSKIDREEHKRLTKDFIMANGKLFENGDVFTACTECENGGPGDPRQNGDVKGHRQFLIDEYKITSVAFRNIDRNVRSNFFPMNGDVAKLVMDKETTKALGGIVVIDHYVKSADKLVEDIKSLSRSSGGKIVLGEFGAPIPDIHGSMTESEQASWLSETLEKLIESEDLIGVNYWTNTGGSTELWNGKLVERGAAETLKDFYMPKTISGVIINELKRPISGATVTLGPRSITTTTNGTFTIPGLSGIAQIEVSAKGYSDNMVEILANYANAPIVLQKQKPGLIYRITSLLLRLVGKI